MKQEIRFCTSADGTRIAYALSGKGPPLVLAANWVTHLEYQWLNLSWRALLETLSKHYTVLRYDTRGCGLSDWNVADISLDGWIHDFEAVISAAGFERFPILGVCQGGAIAVEYAVRHPDQVTKLFLHATFARGRLKRAATPREVELVKLRYEVARAGWANESHAFLRAFAAMWQPGGNAEHQRSWCELQRASCTAETAVRHFQLADDMDVRDAAARVRCPTLVIHAEQDQVVPVEEGRLCAGLIPNARYVQLESENHLLLENEPAWARFLDELAAFIPATPPARKQKPFSDLSAREADVLELLARGRDNAQIAASLDLSEKTVRNYITRVFDKLGVENRAQAIVLARDAGFGVTGATLVK